MKMSDGKDRDSYRGTWNWEDKCEVRAKILSVLVQVCW